MLSFWMHVLLSLDDRKTMDRGYDGQQRIPLLRVYRTLQQHLAKMRKRTQARVCLLWLPLRHPSKIAPLRISLR